MPLTEKQTLVLKFIKSHIAVKGFPPMRKEIADFFGFKSTNAAQEHLVALQRKGAIKLSSGFARSIFIVETPSHQ